MKEEGRKGGRETGDGRQETGGGKGICPLNTQKKAVLGFRKRHKGIRLQPFPKTNTEHSLYPASGLLRVPSRPSR